MNKWQKVACQIARDDLKKPLTERFEFKFKVLKNATITVSKRGRWSFEKLVDYRNWNKSVDF